MCYNNNYIYTILLIIIDMIIINTAFNIQENHSSTLIRKKRYVAFPEGASFSAALCMTVQALAPTDIFTEGLNWGIAYDLPNDTTTGFVPAFKGPRPVLMRKRRSDLYQKIELIMDSTGFSGRSCILRTLCEAAQRYTKGSNLIDEILRIIFHFPQDEMVNNEPTNHYTYQWAHKLGIENNNCVELYPDCPISLLDLMFHGYEESNFNV